MSNDQWMIHSVACGRHVKWGMSEKVCMCIAVLKN